MNNHFDTPVTLRQVTRTQDANGYFTETESKTTVWGDTRSATRTEFFSAEAQGHNVAMMVTIPYIDWNDAEEVIIDNKTYNVVRSYRKTLDYIELTLERI